MEKSKRTVMIMLCAAIFLMAVGFAAFSTTLTIGGTANVTSDWKVVFTNIEVVSKTDGASSKSANASGTSATFDVGLTSPGDNIVYKITVENQGTLDAIIENITATSTANDAIDFEISNIKIGDTLTKKKSTTFNITIRYDSSVTKQPDMTSNTLKVDITYVQNLGQTITPNEPLIEKVITLSQAILRDNTEKNSGTLDLTVKQDDTNGLYYTSTNTEGNKPTYFYRGTVENNYVQFGYYEAGDIVNGVTFTERTPIYWRIVRINEDGSIRMLYVGTEKGEQSVGKGDYAYGNADNAYVGYMYGTVGASGTNAYKLTHTNTNSSRVKDVLDEWYETHIKNVYDGYIADAGFCNDRSIAPQAGFWTAGDTALGYGTSSTTYGAYNRYSKKQPQFICPNSGNDLFTLKESSKGNASLDNAVGLLTADEAFYAGVSNMTDSYLSLGIRYWLMSPIANSPEIGVTMAFDIMKSNSFSIINSVASGNFQGTNTSSTEVDNSDKHIIPVINLNADVQITNPAQNGTIGNEYIIK